MPVVLQQIVLAVAAVTSNAAHHKVCLLAAKRLTTANRPEEKLATCSLVAWRAQRRGLNVPLMVELAWSESSWDMGAVNKTTKVVGPLQVSPRFFCPGADPAECDTIAAAFDAWEYCKVRHRGDKLAALCQYKSGNVCTERGLSGAKRVWERHLALRKKWETT